MQVNCGIRLEWATHQGRCLAYIVLIMRADMEIDGLYLSRAIKFTFYVIESIFCTLTVSLYEMFTNLDYVQQGRFICSQSLPQFINRSSLPLNGLRFAMVHKKLVNCSMTSLLLSPQLLHWPQLWCGRLCELQSSQLSREVLTTLKHVGRADPSLNTRI